MKLPTLLCKCMSVYCTNTHFADLTEEQQDAWERQWHPAGSESKERTWPPDLERK